jgi:hypothetical protein
MRVGAIAKKTLTASSAADAVLPEIHSALLLPIATAIMSAASSQTFRGAFPDTT